MSRYITVTIAFQMDKENFQQRNVHQSKHKLIGRKQTQLYVTYTVTLYILYKFLLYTIVFQGHFKMGACIQTIFSSQLLSLTIISPLFIYAHIIIRLKSFTKHLQKGAVELN